ncbi:MAG: transporter substrate-binding domain-containing protein [Clostridia bacterium]|nr:transporter substrate-binding domain-containing protein [Clostridia bacterium]
MKKFITLLLCVIIACFSLSIATSCGETSKVKLIDIKLTEEEYAIAIGKGKTELKNQVNQALEQIDVDAIIEKYQDMDAVTEGYTIPNSANGIDNPLIVATNAEFAPFEYKMGTQYFGIDIEIAVQLAEKLNKTLVLVNMNLDAIITSVAGVEMDEGVDNDGYDAYTYCDLGIAGLSVTEDRLASVDFTNTYFHSSQVIIVNESDTTFDACETAKDVETLLASFEDKKAGSQSGTTGEYYIKGSGDWLEGFENITFKGYSSHALAVQDLINGNIDFVVSDYETAKAVVANINA